MTALATSADMSPALLARQALTAFIAPDVAADQQPRVMSETLHAITGGAIGPAGAYGALHALAPALDAFRTTDDLRAAIAARSDRERERGAALLSLHGNAIFGSAVPPWPVVRVDMDAAGAGVRGGIPRLLLRPQKAYGTIRIDALTTLCNIPPDIWEHTVGEDAVMELELATWRVRARRDGQDIAVDKDALTRRIAWLCRINLETVRLLRA